MWRSWGEKGAVLLESRSKGNHCLQPVGAKMVNAAHIDAFIVTSNNLLSTLSATHWEHSYVNR